MRTNEPKNPPSGVLKLGDTPPLTEPAGEVGLTIWVPQSLQNDTSSGFAEPQPGHSIVSLTLSSFFSPSMEATRFVATHTSLTLNFWPDSLIGARRPQCLAPGRMGVHSPPELLYER
jgi:hypothetical protein